MKSILFVLTMTAAAAANAAMTAKTAWTQRWPWQTKVDIDFTLAGGEKCDVEVKANYTANGVAKTLDLEHAGLVGDTWELEPGTYHLEWDPAAAGLDVETLKDFSVTVTPVEDAMVSRKYIVANVSSGKWEYRSDVPEGGWAPAGKYTYELDNIVFARIPAGEFQMGLTDAEVAHLSGAGGKVGTTTPRTRMKITHDYYLGIFKLTDAQWARIMNIGDWRANDQNPKSDTTSFYPLQRGSNDVEGINWPLTKFKVKPESPIGRFRARLGGRFHVDFPTSAQWERAARGGTDTIWYNGGTTATSYQNCTNLINEIAYTFMRTDKTVDQYAIGRSGQYAPNAYGLYDVLGMRPEYVLDRYVDQATIAAETVDPVGPTGGTRRLGRGVHMEKSHALVDFAHCTLQAHIIDSCQQNTQLACRYAIHLRPPKSFHGQWE